MLEQLQFEDYEELACDISDTYDSLDDEYGEVSIVAKYYDAKEIIKELLCMGYDVASINLYREEYEKYYDEYLINLNFDGVWCEKFKRDTGYFTDESAVIYIMGNCSSNVIPYCKSKKIYEVSVGDSSEEHSYMVNGKSVDKDTFDEYVAKFAPESVGKEDDMSEHGDYSICIKRNLGAYEASEIIKDMERRMMHMDDMLREMNCFRQLFNWHLI